MLFQKIMKNLDEESEKESLMFFNSQILFHFNKIMQKKGGSLKCPKKTVMAQFDLISNFSKNVKSDKKFFNFIESNFDKPNQLTSISFYYFCQNFEGKTLTSIIGGESEKNKEFGNYFLNFFTFHT